MIWLWPSKSINAAQRLSVSSFKRTRTSTVWSGLTRWSGHFWAVTRGASTPASSENGKLALNKLPILNFFFNLFSYATYHYSASHVRFDAKAFQSVFPKDTVYLTVIRSPLEHYESTFNFFYSRHHTLESAMERQNDLCCWGMPFAAVSGWDSSAIDKFIFTSYHIFSHFPQFSNF